MDEKDADDAAMSDLVIQLCTRIGMMMEDVSPLALDASRAGLKLRIAEVARATRVMVRIADAAEALLRR